MSTIDELLDLADMLKSGRARQLRESAGISASNLARELQVTTGALTRWETGERTPQGVNARRYARALHRLLAREAVGGP
jgi:DNA-binding transcriptional regulator YiaG